MADDGSGNYTLESSKFSGDDILQQQKASLSKASAAHVDSIFVDLKNAMNNRLNRNGTKAMTGNLPMGNNDIVDIRDIIEPRYITGNPTFTGDPIVSGTLAVSGHLSANSIGCGGDMTVGGNISGANVLSMVTSTYTPAVTTSNSDGTISMLEEVGQYTTIGNLVICSIDVNASISGSPTGFPRISLPFASDGFTSGAAHLGLYQGIASDKGVYGYIAAGDSYLTLQNADSANDFSSGVQMSDIGSNLLVRATIIYMKAP